MSNQQQFEKGDKVFRRYDPGRHGYITGRSRPRAGDIYYQVEFSDTLEYVPNYELEHASGGRPDEFEAIERRNFGKISDLRRNFSHIQISGNLSSLIYSLDITNTEFLPYQFKPVLAFLESLSRGLLIADEVGLGKTIEAGLIWTELRARYDCRRILVVCPAMLREKWRDELRDRFGIDATIMNATELLDELKRPLHTISDGKGVICSMQGIRLPSDRQQNQNPSSPRSQLARFLNEQSDNPPIIDLIIIDEAHHMRNSESQTARLGRMLRDVCENVLLLSATPINLRSDDLFNLLKIVDPDLFSDPEFFRQVLQANEPLVKARELVLGEGATAERIRECLHDARDSGNGILSNNSQLRQLIKSLESPQSVATHADRVWLANGIERVNFLRHAINRTRKREVVELNVVRKPYSKFVGLDENGAERKFYDDVTAAIRKYAILRRINDGFLLANPQRQVSSCMYAAAKSWADRAYQKNEQFRQTMIYEDLGEYADSTEELPPLVAYLSASVSVNLQELRDHDSKFNEFHQVIQKCLTENSHEKIIVFSYFRATLYYLSERLNEIDIASQVLVGGMQESKQEAIRRFRDNVSTRVLLSSEVASEGDDLQFCRIVINYDLPWNPMKIEQRIGRLDRIGQKADRITIFNFCYADTIDQRIYERLFERLNIFERALGGMEAILGEKVRELTEHLIRHQLTPDEQSEQIEQAAIAIEMNRSQEEQLERDAGNLLAHSDYILNKIKTAHNLKKRITEEDLIVYVKDYLDKQPGHEFHQPDGKKHHFNIKLPAKVAAEFEEYNKEKNLRGQTRLATGDRAPCEFINKTIASTGRREQINQFHPLIRFISAKLSGEDFYPLVAVKLRHAESDTGLSLPDGQYAFAVDKWSFTGLRDEGDMRVRVMHTIRDFALDAEDSWKLLNAVRLSGEDWPESATAVSPRLGDKILECYDYLAKEFHKERAIKESENENRINVQITSTERQRKRQVESLERVLEKLRAGNKMQMVPATLGRIEKLGNRFEVKIDGLKSKQAMKSAKQLVCCGVLLIN